jgi:hypothetical protein
MIGKTIDVSVTSVLQTTAGKMIFGKWDERGRGSISVPPPTAPIITSAAVPAAVVSTILTETKPTQP